MNKWLCVAIAAYTIFWGSLFYQASVYGWTSAHIPVWGVAVNGGSIVIAVITGIIGAVKAVDKKGETK